MRPGPVLLCARRDTICAICVVVGEGVLGVGEGEGEEKAGVGCGGRECWIEGGGGVVGVCVGGGGGWGVHINMLDFSEWGMIENI